MAECYSKQLRRTGLTVFRSNTTPESRYVVEKRADKAAVNAETKLLAATKAEEEGRP